MKNVINVKHVDSKYNIRYFKESVIFLKEF